MTLLDRYLRSISELGVERSGRKTYHDQPQRKWFRGGPGEESWRLVGACIRGKTALELLGESLP